MKKIFGLVGFPLIHSFSKEYFTRKFKEEGWKDYEYRNFELKNIAEFPKIISETEGLSGLNITIPYKSEILQYVDFQSDVVKEINAANTLVILSDRKILADNTDVVGFEQSIKPYLESHHKRALILGTGGAAKAVAYVFKKLRIPYLFVSRTPRGRENMISYAELDKFIFKQYQIVVNTTPVGSYPHTSEMPVIPYDFVTDLHLFYDLIYNPSQTNFLEKASIKGAKTLNGLKMLHLQAEASWKIWQKKSGD